MTLCRSSPSAVLAVLCAVAASAGAAPEAIAQGVIHVTKAGSPAPTGERSAPYHLVEAGIVRTRTTSAATVEIRTGDYHEIFRTGTPCMLKAVGGPITIGKRNYQASTSIQLITLNTHLAGDEAFFPSWQDYERADDIADFIRSLNPAPDAVAFQEIWDEDLFFGGDGANGILPRSGFPHGDHGDAESAILNSGAALMAQHPLIDFAQLEWDECDGIECHAAKGWVQATMVKEGFSIGLFSLHTQAGEDADSVKVRGKQVAQLTAAVQAYRDAHRGDVVFVMGDFNIYGEEFEYDTALIPLFGLSTDGRDADRNSPGFLFGVPATQWTLCDCNLLATWFDEETRSGRLDYIFYSASLDGSVEVIPTSVAVRPFFGRTLTEGGISTNQSSDHWGVQGHFRLLRR